MFAARLKTQIQITSLRHNFGLYFLGSVKLIERNFVFADCHWHAIQLQLNINKGYLLDYYFSRIEKCICYWFVRIPAWLDLSHLSAAKFYSFHCWGEKYQIYFVRYLLISFWWKNFQTRPDDVLLEHDGLPHVLPLAIHLRSARQVGGNILSLSYSLSFFVGPLLHA